MAMPAVNLRPYDDDALPSGGARLLMCGKSFVADKTGALYWPAEETLALSDLLLCQGSYLDQADAVMPPYDTASPMEKLEEALERYDPKRVIALGDSFKHGGALCAHDFDWLLDLMDGREWFWVTGPDGAPPPRNTPGRVVPHVTVGGVKFRHEPVRAPVSHEISGSMHPVATISDHDFTVTGRCFVSNGLRVALPSVGRCSAGANILDDIFEPLLGRNGLFVWVILHGRVRQVAAGQLMLA
ncbi:MAG: phosphoesterase [Hyphomicrobiales bacterium]|nr:phosphoesterase [Hyphomicrobiales bacterium]